MKNRGLLSPKEFFNRRTTTSVVLVVNTLAWYFIVFDVLQKMIESTSLTTIETVSIFALNLTTAAVSALLGGILSSRAGNRIPLFAIWLTIGVSSSLLPLVLTTSNLTTLYILAFTFGVSLSLGLPSCMAYFAESTEVNNRARAGGFAFLASGITIFLFGLTLDVTQFAATLTILCLWRASAFVVLPFISSIRRSAEAEQPHSYLDIFRQRSFALYMVPWIMFCLVNQTAASIAMPSLSREFVDQLTIVSFALNGISAVVSGFFCDKIGRKRIAVLGFIMIGLGYAILGISGAPAHNVWVWYAYTVTDGVAWGAFYTIFFFTIWGDMAQGARSDKHYALGGLPYLLSNFLSFAMGPYIAEAFSLYTVFSLASFFLFLAVLPLMYAPETLPEKRIRDIELKSYIDQAQKAKQKYA